jgi:hypothetical protein
MRIEASLLGLLKERPTHLWPQDAKYTSRTAKSQRLHGSGCERSDSFSCVQSHNYILKKMSE